MFLAVPQVDVVTDGFDWWNAVFGAGGTVAAFVAIVLARRAQKTADHAVTEERRRTFELEILRELMKDLDETSIASKAFREPGQLKQYRLRLDLLSTPLEFWDLAPELAGQEAIAVAFGVGDEHRALAEAITGAGSDVDEIRETRDAVVKHLSFSGTAENGVYKLQVEATPESMELDARLGEAQARYLAATREMAAFTQRLSRRFRERLAHDVRQAIWSRVEARPIPELTWWRRVWLWIENSPAWSPGLERWPCVSRLGLSSTIALVRSRAVLPESVIRSDWLRWPSSAPGRGHRICTRSPRHCNDRRERAPVLRRSGRRAGTDLASPGAIPWGR